MGITVKVAGKPEWNASGYNVVEDSTPIDPSDTSGGYGQLTLTIPETRDSKEIRGREVELEDTDYGTTVGSVVALSGDHYDLAVTADSRLSQLAATRTAAPFSGTLTAALNYYFGLVGITTGIVIDTTKGSQTVALLGFTGDIWEFVNKKLAPAFGIEISLVSNNVVVRDLRTIESVNHRDSSYSWNMDASLRARAVEVYYYETQAVTSGLIYPAGGWNPDTPIFTVDAGDTIEETIELSASVSSVQQPTPVLNIGPDYRDSSVYTVSGADGLPIPPAQWLAQGGRLEVEIGEDTRTLTVRITGASEPKYAPYRIAVASSASDSYATLRILGTGVTFNKQKITVQTGVDPLEVTEEIGVTIDNECIRTQADAYDAGAKAAMNYGGPRLTINVSTTGINRAGESGSYVYATIEDFNEEYAGLTIAQFNTIWAGKTIAQFNEYWTDKVQADYANQAFGNVAGSRVRDGDMYYRIRTANGTEGGWSYTAESDTTIADFNAAWAGKTIAEFNAFWANKTIADFGVAPLRTEN